MKLAEATWADVGQLDRAATVVLAPIAACEQHGPHLPTFTDSILCGAIADAVHARRPEMVLLLPVFWLGASDHHLPFGATLSVDAHTHARLLADLVLPPLNDGFRRLLILNGHGGNIDTLHVALRGLQPRFPTSLLTGASYWELAADPLARIATGPRKTMGHACEFETSLMLHLRPELVRLEQCADDPAAAPDGLEGLFIAEDMKQRTMAGCVGYPCFATAENGRRMFQAIVDRVTAVCDLLADSPLPESGE